MFQPPNTESGDGISENCQISTWRKKKVIHCCHYSPACPQSPLCKAVVGNTALGIGTEADLLRVMGPWQVHFLSQSLFLLPTDSFLSPNPLIFKSKTKTNPLPIPLCSTQMRTLHMFSHMHPKRLATPKLALNEVAFNTPEMRRVRRLISWFCPTLSVDFIIIICGCKHHAGFSVVHACVRTNSPSPPDICYYKYRLCTAE